MKGKNKQGMAGLSEASSSLFLMHMKNLLLIALLGLGNLYAQSDNDCYATREFLIAGSLTDYASALQQAQKVAKGAGLKLDLRGLRPVPKVGLSFDDTLCVNEWGEAPCYVARGRYDNGSYISIEYSDAYAGFRPGYYIVVAHSGEAGKTPAAVLSGVRRIVPSAYIKSSKVYMCCMH
ncbi:MAG: hypothetical protein ACK5XN_26890 [Bacteroidota bacterium]|jgi:hypothetical protein